MATSNGHNTLRCSDALLEAISNLAVDDLAAVLHDDLCFEVPYEEDIPALDRAGMLDRFRVVVPCFERFTLTLTSVHEMVDPDVLVAEYDGECPLRTSGFVYRNRYISVIAFRDGKIVQWREHDNPLEFARLHEALSSTEMNSPWADPAAVV